MNLWGKIKSTTVKKGEIAIFWLGQAGFIIKDQREKIIAIDPYLSDCCYRIYGFKRMTPKLIAPHELEADILCISHHHEDHLDVDAVPIIMSNSKTRLFSSQTSIDICRKMKIETNRLFSLAYGDTASSDDIKIKAVFADHGKLAPDAIGFILDLDNIKIYFTGDTSYCPEKLNDLIKLKPDVIIFPINGAYGNLNSEEAAKLAGETGARLAIPCHFWTFIEHGGNPEKLYNEMKNHAPECQLNFMYQGEMIKYIKQEVMK